jgi:hypothetical protein
VAVAVTVTVVVLVTMVVSVIRPRLVRRVCVTGLVIVLGCGAVGHERALRDQCRDYAAYAGKLA